MGGYITNGQTFGEWAVGIPMIWECPPEGDVI